MSPPNAPGVPGTKLPPAKREERRPPMSNPPPAESPPQPPAFRHARSSSQHDVQAETADDRPSMVEFQQAVHAQFGKASFSGPAWVFLILLVVVLLAVIIYLLATRAQPVAANCATIDQVRAVDTKVDTLSTSFSTLTEKVITDNQRMHNDFVQLELRLIERQQPK